MFNSLGVARVDNGTVLFAFSLTFFAGLSTGIGSFIVFFARETNKGLLSFVLGFSAGVMLYVSFVEIFVKAREALSHELSEIDAYRLTVFCFFLGMALIALIDQFVPHQENPHEMHLVEEVDHPSLRSDPKLHRMGLTSALAIAIHNFPEGLATFTAALSEPALGISIAIAIALHNIPEGMAVAIPIFYSTGSRKKAFFHSFWSGLAEPLGAVIGYFLFIQFFNDIVFGMLFAGVAGIMVFVSLDQLLPTAEKYGEHHLAIYGVVSGMVVIAASLLI